MWRFDAYPSEHRSSMTAPILPALRRRLTWIFNPVVAAILIIGGTVSFLTAAGDAVAVGEVIESTRHLHHGRRFVRTSHHVTVEYRPAPVDGPAQTLTYTGHHDDALPVGALVEVYHDPQNPSRASFTSGSSQRLGGTVIAVVGGVMAVLWTGVRVRKRNTRPSPG